MYATAISTSSGPPAPWATSTQSVEPAKAPETQSQENVFPAFLSPVLSYDQQARLAILSFRDSTTGETVQQYPPKRVVDQYRRSNADDQVSSQVAKALVTAANSQGSGAGSPAKAGPASGSAGAASGSTGAASGSAAGSSGASAEAGRPGPVNTTA